MKINAIYINKKLGSKIFNENILDKLVLIEYTEKQIQELYIDDLIEDGEWTSFLIRLVDELEKNA